MASNKKPKKKYKPRTIFFPNLIIAMHSMQPIEEAIEAILIHGKILEDEVGNYVYKTGEGSLESFEAGLDIYNFVISDICSAKSINWSPVALIKLREVMVAKGVFDEDLLEEAKQCLSDCRRILSSISPNELRASVAKVRDYREKKKAAEVKME